MDLSGFSQYEKELARLETELSQPATATQPGRLRDLTRRHVQLVELLRVANNLRAHQARVAECEEIIQSGGDKELVALALEELAQAQAAMPQVEDTLKRLLLPRDKEDEANTIVEIRAGTGGEEASLFAADLYRMYSRYAERKGWRVETMSTSASETRGIKEVIFSIEGDSIYRFLKYEAGVHRVQRVPVTEANGRIHTSAASVAILPELEDIEIEIDPTELRIDSFRSSGAGGQHVNVTDSAVRITHIPTGVVVSCQDERSQHKNRAKGMRILKARLYERARAEALSQRAEQRKSMVRSGDRSDKIRTYNFPQNRVTDHRIGLSVHALEEILDGNLDKIIQPLIEHDTHERLNQLFATAA